MEFKYKLRVNYDYSCKKSELRGYLQHGINAKKIIADQKYDREYDIKTLYKIVNNSGIQFTNFCERVYVHYAIIVIKDYVGYHVDTEFSFVFENDNHSLYGFKYWFDEKKNVCIDWVNPKTVNKFGLVRYSSMIQFNLFVFFNEFMRVHENISPFDKSFAKSTIRIDESIILYECKHDDKEDVFLLTTRVRYSTSDSESYDDHKSKVVKVKVLDCYRLKCIINLLKKLV